MKLISAWSPPFLDHMFKTHNDGVILRIVSKLLNLSTEKMLTQIYSSGILFYSLYIKPL